MSQNLPKRRPVWWIVALTITLIAFEIAREGWVMAENQPVVSGNLSIAGSASEGFVIARGTWKRSDNGSPMVPGATEIRCDKSLNICVEATSTVASESRYMFMSVDFFTPTEFSDSAVAYENDNPLCAKYAVRVDLAQKRVMATRERKENPKLEQCKDLEQRIAMELGDGHEALGNFKWMESHFLPIARLVRAFL